MEETYFWNFKSDPAAAEKSVNSIQIEMGGFSGFKPIKFLWEPEIQFTLKKVLCLIVA